MYTIFTIAMIIRIYFYTKQRATLMVEYRSI